VPGHNLRQRVRAGDEEQLNPIAALSTQVAQRIDRVRGAPRSMSIRLTENRGFDAVAITVIR
jgi:hypothetical protein